MELIFILTYDCNFRCSYCDIDKRKEDMSKLVLEKSLSFLGTENFNIEKVKFFGGEPLMQKDAIKKIVQKFPKKYSPNFYVTSNSTLVTADFIDFANNNNITITFSLDGAIETNNENRVLVNGGNLSELIVENTKKYSDIVRINQVITDKNSENFFENFLYIYGLGVREFNFLPEYYRVWSKKGLCNLQKGFAKIENFYKSGNKFNVVNTENYSETAFFNLGIVIDTDGSIYATNLMLAGIFEKYKPILKIGNIYTGLSKELSEEFLMKYKMIVQDCLEKEHSGLVLKSVYYVDRLLSNFTRRIQEIS